MYEVQVQHKWLFTNICNNI